MFSDSNIDHDTIQAYLQTHYRVLEPVALFMVCHCQTPRHWVRNLNKTPSFGAVLTVHPS
jgi:hypothetical protein